MSDEIEIGDRVMVISNNDEPIIIGEVISFDINIATISKLPIVKEEKTEKEYLCFGIVLKFDQKLLQELESLSYEDRWNKLSWNKMEKE